MLGLVFTACSSPTSPKKIEDDLIVMDRLWNIKASKDEVLKQFGKGYSDVEEGVEYRLSEMNKYEKAFFFDNNESLIEQFAVVTLEELEQFKKSVHCTWNERKARLRQVDVVLDIKSGNCKEKQISYSFDPVGHLYEIRWKN